MNFLMDSLPNVLRNWFNGLQILTLKEIEEAEKTYQIGLVNAYAEGIITKEEANEAWATWQEMKADEISYLEAA